ncbi:MAG: hypothetical protein Q4B03_09980 [Lachnospiraceae bacterium]|nr:hypothetical protein [Lachnospiraceae bacterium]
MKNKQIRTILGTALLTAILAVSGCGSSGSTNTGSTGSSDTETESGTAVSSEEQEEKADTGEKTEGTEQTEEQDSYTILLDSSNDNAICRLIGAEKVVRGDYTYLRCYVERTNLTDYLQEIQPGFDAMQGEKSVYVTGCGYDFLNTYAEEEGIVDEETRAAAMEHMFYYTPYMMPGVTHQRIIDIRLESEEDVTLQMYCGVETEELTLELDNLPGPPSSMKRLQPVEDPEIWKDAVTAYSDSGIINHRRVGELACTLNGVELIEDTYGYSHTGKLLRLDVNITNNSEKELKAQRTIENWELITLIQDGVNLRNIFGYLDLEDTVIAPGENADLSLYYQPLSENPVFAVGVTNAMEPSDKDFSGIDVFGMVFSLE